MKFQLVALGALCVAGCSYAVHDPSTPADQDIRQVEQALAAHPCVGNLDQWERNYRFSRKTGLFSPYSLNPDFNIIELHLRRAGTTRIEPGQRVMQWRENEDWPDSSTIRTLDGKFRIEDGMLQMAPCRQAQS
jgi:hypothetical protein